MEGAEAKLAADGLMSAALAMAGAGAHRGASAKKSTAEVRKEETRVALERAALEAGEELSDDTWTTAWTTWTTWTSSPRGGEMVPALQTQRLLLRGTDRG